MKRFFLFAIACLMTQILYGQCNAFFPLKEGVRYAYDHFDKKEKLILRTIQSFKNITGTANAVKATLQQEMIDAKKGDVISTSESEWTCDNGTLHFTMNSMSLNMDNGQQANMGTGMSVDVTGDKMDLPSSLTVGQTLKDINYTIKMAMSGVTIMNRTFAVKDRKVEAKENVTTPAGSFDCYKISFTTTSTGGIGSGTIKSILWYAKDVGLVKSENYKEDGKSIGKQILTSITK